MSKDGDSKKPRSIADVTDDEIHGCCDVRAGRPATYSDQVYEAVKADISAGSVRGSSLQKGSDNRDYAIKIHGAGNPAAKPWTLTGSLEKNRSQSNGGVSCALPSKSTIRRARHHLIEGGVKFRKADPKEARRLQVLANGYNAVSTAAVLAAMGLLVDEKNGICPTERIPHQTTGNYDETTILVNDDTGAVEVAVTQKDIEHLLGLHQSISTPKTVGGPDQKRCVKLGVLTTRAGACLSTIYEIHDKSFETGVKVDRVSNIFLLRIRHTVVLTHLLIAYFTAR